MLSFDWINFICMIINLLILYVLMKKFLFGRVDKILEKRKEEIENDYAEAAKKNEEATKVKKEYQEQLAAIDVEKERVIREADQRANTEYTRIVDDANRKAEEIIRKAKQTADQETEAAMKEQEKQIEKLVLAAAGKIAASQSESDNSRLYDRFLAETSKSASGGRK